MITIGPSDIQSLVIDDSCLQSWPCQHDNSLLTLNDGRSAFWLNGIQLYSIISSIADEKINPQGGWSPDKVRQHFQDYPQQCIEMGEEIPPVDLVLAEIFAQTIDK